MKNTFIATTLLLLCVFVGCSKKDSIPSSSGNELNADNHTELSNIVANSVVSVDTTIASNTTQPAVYVKQVLSWHFSAPSFVGDEAKLVDDLGLDELNLYDFFSQLETYYQITINFFDRETLTTVGKVIDHIEKKIEVHSDPYSETKTLSLASLDPTGEYNLPVSISFNLGCDINYRKDGEFKAKVISIEPLRALAQTTSNNSNINNARITNSNKDREFDYEMSFTANEPTKNYSSMSCQWSGALKIIIYVGYKCENFNTKRVLKEINTNISKSVDFSYSSGFGFVPVNDFNFSGSSSNVIENSVIPSCYTQGNTGGGNTGGTHTTLTAQQVHNKVIEVLLDDLYTYNGPTITDQTRFIEDLNYDYLDIIELGMKMEIEFNGVYFDLTYENYQDFLTVGAFCDYIIAHP